VGLSSLSLATAKMIGCASKAAPEAAQLIVGKMHRRCNPERVSGRHRASFDFAQDEDKLLRAINDLISS
jgi:hypothetical protein